MNPISFEKYTFNWSIYIMLFVFYVNITNTDISNLNYIGKYICWQNAKKKRNNIFGVIFF